MRTIKVLFITVLLGLITVSAQTVQVEKSYALFKNGEYKGSAPVLNKEGNLLVFSPAQGQLAVYDFSARSVTTISEESDQAFEPVFSNDAKKILYKNTVYNSRLRYDGVKSFDLEKQEVKEIMSPEREVKALRSYDNGLMLVRSNKMVKATYGKATQKLPPYIWSDGVDLNIYVDGKQKKLNPFDDASGYIWASLSPDETKIVFTAVGRGTFVSDLQGNIITNLGFLNAPVWYGNDFIVGMNDQDDGHTITSSEILIKDLNGKISQTLSDSNQIALDPTAAGEAGKVAYATSQGDIFVVELSVTK